MRNINEVLNEIKKVLKEDEEYEEILARNRRYGVFIKIYSTRRYMELCF